MPTFYLTFGYDTPYRHSYQRVHAPDYIKARETAFAEHGRNWAFLYEADEFKDQPKDYDLTPLRKELHYGVTA